MQVGRSAPVWAAGRFFAAAAAFACAQQANADVLTVTAKGTIPPACSISVADPLPAADLTVSSGRVKGTAAVDCNTGFVIKAMSEHGALTTNAAVSRGFTNVLPYYLQVAVPLTGTSDVLLARCNSKLLTAGNSACSLSPDGPGLSSGGKPAIRKTAVVTVIWSYSKPKPVAGAYHDTISISVAAAP
ncbi:MAG: hypothetical protein ACM3ZV_13420 [Bacillota bacterium]